MTVLDVSNYWKKALTLCLFMSHGSATLLTAIYLEFLPSLIQCDGVTLHVVKGMPGP